MNEIIQPLAFFVGSLVAGLIAGYFLKKFIKIGLFIVGGLILFAIVLQGFGWVAFDFNKITADATQFANNTQLVPVANQFISNFNIVYLVSFTIGTVIGFVKTG